MANRAPVNPTLPESTDTPPPEELLADGDAAARTSKRVLLVEVAPPPKLDIPPDGGIEQPIDPALAILQEDGSAGRWWIPEVRPTAGFCVSLVVHTFLLVFLALMVENVGPVGNSSSWLTATLPGRGDTGEPALLLPEGSESVLFEQELVASTTSGAAGASGSPRVTLPTAISDTVVQPLRAGNQQDLLAVGELFRAAGVVTGGGLDGRDFTYRHNLVESGNEDGGPTRASEEAVERALNWLSAHQRKDGAWDFNHHKSLCHGLCRNPGDHASTTAATSLVLLAYLGAGHTHLRGEHREAVQRGIYYLRSRAMLTSNGIDLREGTMYAQGMAAIALCEAYAMTEDETLRELAQGSIDFIIRAQDGKGGGWRYTPGVPGDLTMTGWQVMALKSADLGGLNVPSPSWFLVDGFLDGVACDGGAQYGYLEPTARRSTTAVGLLLRMYRGWSRDHASLGRGVEHLSEWGPSTEDLYYDYYATQVMFHWGGSDWERWNRPMRDGLVAMQATSGHESGSWYMPSEHCEPGGRLLCTTLAVMTLEVYYRYLPLYDSQRWKVGD